MEMGVDMGKPRAGFERGRGVRGGGGYRGGIGVLGVGCWVLGVGCGGGSWRYR